MKQSAMDIFEYDIILIIQILIVVVSSYLVGKVAARLLARLFDKTPFPENIEQSLVKGSKNIVYVIGVLIIVTLVGFDVTSVIVGLGALSIAIGFAMKDIIQNLVSGILVQLDKPFKKGDTIEVQGFVGRVMRMRVRTTVLQTEKGELVHIPNSVFATKPVVNKNLGITSEST
jgi:small conductance mechanosensitive channel|tara:strand:+ start:175 stop:693 length:519 start_codon:yes stop_codon:yes gene_type:complete